MARLTQEGEEEQIETQLIICLPTSPSSAMRIGATSATSGSESGTRAGTILAGSIGNGWKRFWAFLLFNLTAGIWLLGGEEPSDRTEKISVDFYVSCYTYWVCCQQSFLSHILSLLPTKFFVTNIEFVANKVLSHRPITSPSGQSRPKQSISVPKMHVW